MAEHDGARKSSPNHGGARPGSGAKKKPINGEDPYLLRARAQAKREAFKADLAELEYRREIGELYRRDEVMRTFTTAMAIMVEQLRSIPDKMEREAGISPSQAEIAERVIDAQLEEIRAKIIEAMDSE